MARSSTTDSKLGAIASLKGESGRPLPIDILEEGAANTTEAINAELVRDFELYAPELPDALVELYDVQATARDEGGKIPSNIAVENAKRILIDLYRASPRIFAVDPLPEGEVAIDAATKYGTSLVVLCRSDGSAQCLAYFDDEYHSKDYPSSSMLPDDFLWDILRLTAVSSD